MNGINFEEIYKHKLVKNCKNYSDVKCDIYISKSAENAKFKSVNVKYINPIFTFYKFISFIPYKGTLYLELSNINTDGNGYAISRSKGKSYHTKVSGDNYNALIDFCGKYNITIINKSVKGKTMLCYLKEEVQ